jgi:hypothetical protein
MLIPFDDTMPNFMNFRRVFDLQEFKNQVSQCLWQSQDAEVFEIHSHFFMALKLATKDTYDFLSHSGALEHVHVVQI